MVLPYSVRLRRRAMTRPGLSGALGSMRLSAVSMAFASCSRSFCSGWGLASSGGISWELILSRTCFQSLRSARTDASVVYLTRFKSALGLGWAPWHLVQYFVRRGWMLRP